MGCSANLRRGLRGPTWATATSVTGASTVAFGTLRHTEGHPCRVQVPRAEGLVRKHFVDETDWQEVDGFDPRLCCRVLGRRQLCSIPYVLGRRSHAQLCARRLLRHSHPLGDFVIGNNNGFSYDREQASLLL